MGIPEGKYKERGANINLGEQISFIGFEVTKALESTGFNHEALAHGMLSSSSTAQQLAVWDASDERFQEDHHFNPSISLNAAALEIFQLSQPHSPPT